MTFDLPSAIAGSLASGVGFWLTVLFLDFRRRPPAAPSVSLQLAGMEKRIMSALSDAVATLTADDAALSAEVDTLITTIQGIPATVAKAVQDALTAAGVDDAAAVTALAAVDTAVKASTQKAIDALTPPPPPPAA